MTVRRRERRTRRLIVVYLGPGGLREFPYRAATVAAAVKATRRRRAGVRRILGVREP